VLTDLLDDRAWRILPLTDLDADAMVGSLKSSPLLDGFRGSPVVDKAALLDVLHRVAQLADAVPEIAELDLNPVIVTTAGAVAVDAKIRLAPRPPEPDPYVRRLR
jgi:acyl-CoA synthetase (NDP forming)